MMRGEGSIPFSAVSSVDCQGRLQSGVRPPARSTVRRSEIQPLRQLSLSADSLLPIDVRRPVHGHCTGITDACQSGNELLSDDELHLLRPLHYAGE